MRTTLSVAFIIYYFSTQATINFNFLKKVIHVEKSRSESVRDDVFDRLLQPSDSFFTVMVIVNNMISLLRVNYISSYQEMCTINSNFLSALSISVHSVLSFALLNSSHLCFFVCFLI